ncbi:MAG: hypothetical protein SPH01_01965 [Prevotella sp.]|nr:hypothetical protein [Prevotella sp.]
MIRRCFLAALLFCAVSCPMMAQGGKAKIDAPQLAAGVYVVKAEGQSLKMVKR